jgi:hypothetical protein
VLTFEKSADPDIDESFLKDGESLSGCHGRQVEQAESSGQGEGSGLPGHGASEDGASDAELLSNLPHVSEHVDVLSGLVAAIAAIDAEVKEVAEGAVPARAAAL